ncbi:MAG: Ig-like domain-containing protein [Urechidicola sp.]|nr:Ig-like domain-containing protein [Urechidicola sp.]
MRDAPADTFPPLVSSFSPADNATGVDVNTNFTINFNEDVQVGTGSIYVKIASNGTTIYTVNVSNTSVTGSTVTFSLPDNLFRLTNYFINIDAGAFTDLAGNDYAGISNNITWNFTTATASDVSPPSVSLFTPTNNATNVSIANDLTIVFNEAVQLYESAVLKDFGGSVIPSTSTVSGNTLTINPTSDLTNSTQYYVEVAYGAIRDLAGNSFAGISGNTTWNFTTVSSDVTPPSPTVFSPLDNATGVSATNNITITFDEDIQISGGNPILRNFDTNAEVGSFSFVFSGNNLIINPDADLSNNTQYYVEIANGVIQDMDGNGYAGLSGNAAWNFTTINSDVTAPSPVTFSPTDNANDVSISNNLVLTFDEDIQISGGRAVLKNFITNVEIGSSSSASGNQLIINPTSDLTENTQYYIEIANGIIQDLTGNGYAGFSGNSTWNFTTVLDGTPPSTMTFSPASGTTGVSASDDLTLVFNENIQISGGRAVLRNFNTNVEIASSSSVVGNRLFINPTADLDPNTQFYVEIADGIIQDMAGNGYAGFSGNATWNFTTGNVLATADFDLKQHLSIYPNPTNGLLNIQIADYNEDLTVEIFDILGKKVESKVFVENNNQINLSNLPTGIYLLKATASNKSYTTRIIKK